MRCPTLPAFVTALVVVCTFPASFVQAVDMPRPLFIEGYAGRLSYAPGQEAELHVSTSTARFSVQVHRIGTSNELVWSKRDVPGAE